MCFVRWLKTSSCVYRKKLRNHASSYLIVTYKEFGRICEPLQSSMLISCHLQNYSKRLLKPRNLLRLSYVYFLSEQILINFCSPSGFRLFFTFPLFICFLYFYCHCWNQIANTRRFSKKPLTIASLCQSVVYNLNARTSSENVTLRFCDHISIIPSLYACKMCFKYPGAKLESALHR